MASFSAIMRREGRRVKLINTKVASLKRLSLYLFCTIIVGMGGGSTGTQMAGRFPPPQHGTSREK